MQNGKTERKKNPIMHTHTDLYDWTFATSIGCQAKKTSTLRFAEMTQRTGKSECKFCIWAKVPDDFWICLLSLSLMTAWSWKRMGKTLWWLSNPWWREAYKKHSVCSSSCLFIANILFGCKAVMSWSPSCCWDYMNKGMLPWLACSAFSSYSLQILDYQNRALLMQ